MNKLLILVVMSVMCVQGVEGTSNQFLKAKSPAKRWLGFSKLKTSIPQDLSAEQIMEDKGYSRQAYRNAFDNVTAAGTGADLQKKVIRFKALMRALEVYRHGEKQDGRLVDVPLAKDVYDILLQKFSSNKNKQRALRYDALEVADELLRTSNPPADGPAAAGAGLGASAVTPVRDGGSAGAGTGGGTASASVGVGTGLRAVVASPADVPVRRVSPAVVDLATDGQVKECQLPKTVEDFQRGSFVTDFDGDTNNFTVKHQKYGTFSVNSRMQNRVLVTLGSDKMRTIPVQNGVLQWTAADVVYFRDKQQVVPEAASTDHPAASGPDLADSPLAGATLPAGDGTSAPAVANDASAVGAPGASTNAGLAAAASATHSSATPPALSHGSTPKPERKPKGYGTAVGFALPTAFSAAVWGWLLATKQGRELLGSMRKLFTKKGRASMTRQQRREALEDLLTLAVTSLLGVGSGAYAGYRAYDAYTHNKQLELEGRSS